MLELSSSSEDGAKPEKANVQPVHCAVHMLLENIFSEDDAEHGKTNVQTEYFILHTDALNSHF